MSLNFDKLKKKTQVEICLAHRMSELGYIVKMGGKYKITGVMKIWK